MNQRFVFAVLLFGAFALNVAQSMTDEGCAIKINNYLSGIEQKYAKQYEMFPAELKQFISSIEADENGQSENGRLVIDFERDSDEDIDRKMSGRQLAASICIAPLRLMSLVLQDVQCYPLRYTKQTMGRLNLFTLFHKATTVCQPRNAEVDAYRTEMTNICLKDLLRQAESFKLPAFLEASAKKWDELYLLEKTKFQSAMFAQPEQLKAACDEFRLNYGYQTACLFDVDKIEEMASSSTTKYQKLTPVLRSVAICSGFQWSKDERS